MAATYQPAYPRATLRGAHDAIVAGTEWRRVGARALASRRGGRHPVVKTSVSLAAPAAEVWQHLVVDVVTSMGSWNDAYRGGAVLGDDGAGVRRIVTRARLPRPFRDREDDFEQHAFSDDNGVYWELSRASPAPVTPAPGHAPGRVLLAAKQIVPDGDGCTVVILWHYQLGGVLDLLPLAVRESALAGNLDHECERMAAMWGTPKG